MGPNESNTLYDQLPSSVSLPPFPTSGYSQSSFSMPNLSGLFPVGANLLNMWFQGRQNRLNREFSAQQSELSWQRGLEQWYRESAYNSPANQMRLLKEAGLNPNLAYDQSTTPAESPVYHPSQYQGIAPQMDPLTMAQTNLMNAQANNLNADTSNKRAEQPGIYADAQDKLNTLLARQNLTDTWEISVETDDGKVLTYDQKVPVNYWAIKTNTEKKEIYAAAEYARYSEEDARAMYQFINETGLTTDIAQIEKTLSAMSKDYSDINLNQAHINALAGEIAEQAIIAKMLDQVNCEIDKLPPAIQPAARFIVVLLNKSNFSFRNPIRSKSTVTNNTTIDKTVTHVK